MCFKKILHSPGIASAIEPTRLIGTYTCSDCYDAAHKGTNTHARHLRHVLTHSIVGES